MRLLSLLSQGIALLLVASSTSVAALPAVWETESEINNGTLTLQSRSVQFAWGSTKLRGVNIGGWLVLEPWIKPSMFSGLKGHAVDEYTFCRYLGRTEASKRLQAHWKTWITQNDFLKIKERGFNAVRIPIGYWAYALATGDTYVQGAAAYMDQAIGMARYAGLKVIIDLHGAPGSQNGFDNSGRKSSIPYWTHGTYNINLTLQVYNIIAKKYAASRYWDVVIAIEMLNEPLGPQSDMNKVKGYYNSAYSLTRAVSDTPVMLHDAFYGIGYWAGFLTGAGRNAIVDTHIYQVFDNNLIAMTPAQHIAQVSAYTDGLRNGKDKWTIVGEWSGAMTDCALWLNGYGVGARMDGTFPGSTYRDNCWRYRTWDHWTNALRVNTHNYIRAQIKEWETYSDGWVFWTWKTENTCAPEWDAYFLTGQGLFW